MMEMSRIAFMHGQSESQSSNTERLYYFCQENLSFLPMCSSKAIEGKPSFDISS